MQSSPFYIEAPARIHLGFIDLDGVFGRRFGGLGLTINEITTKLVISSAEVVSVVGDTTGRVQKLAENFFEKSGVIGGCHIEVSEQIIDHSGLGSGTQLALAVGTGISKLYELDCSYQDVAVMLNRGSRSGIGIGAFQQGGFLVDGGKSTDCLIPPVISRLQFPSHWRILLALDLDSRGLHGRDERTSFTALPRFTAEKAAYMSHLLIMKVLPGLCEENIGIFSEGIYEIQRSMGEYFASAQGGRYTSTLVGNAIMYLEALGIKGIGQSSWGPTGFAFTDSETQAYDLLRDLQEKYSDNKNLQFKIVSGRNTGATIEEQDIVSLPQAKS